MVSTFGYGAMWRDSEYSGQIVKRIINYTCCMYISAYTMYVANDMRLTNYGPDIVIMANALIDM